MARPTRSVGGAELLALAAAFDLQGHSVAPGNLYPFVSTQTTSFCQGSCAAPSYDWLTLFVQESGTPLTTRKVMALCHGLLALLAVFVFYPAGVMFARYGKDYPQRCCHQFLWLHVSAGSCSC